MLTEVNMNEILGGGESTKPRQILISEKAWMNRLVHINIWPGNYDLVSDQTSFFIFVGRAWPISFINSPGHFFFVFIFCIFLLHAHAFTEQSSEEGTVVFIPGHHLLRQEEKRALLKTPKLGGSVKGVNRDREGGMDGAQEGRPSQTLGTIWSAEWLSFVRIRRERVGGKRRASDSVWSRRGHSVATRLHTPLPIVRGGK